MYFHFISEKYLKIINKCENKFNLNYITNPNSFRDSEALFIFIIFVTHEFI